MKIVMTGEMCILTKTELTSAIYAKYEHLKDFAADLIDLTKGVAFDNLIDGYKVVVSPDSVTHNYIRSVFDVVESGEREEMLIYLIKADFTMFVECKPVVRTRVDLGNYLLKLYNTNGCITFDCFVCSRQATMNLVECNKLMIPPDFCIKGKFWKIVQDNMSSTEIEYIRTLVSMSLSNKRSGDEVRALLHACEGVTIERVEH